MSSTLTIELASAVTTSRADEARRAIAVQHLAAARERRRRTAATVRRIARIRVAVS
jgi:hypothetical protein